MNRYFKKAVSYFKNWNRAYELALIMCPQWGVNMPYAGFGYISSYLESKSVPHLVYDMNIKLFWDAPEKDRALWDFDKHRYWVDEQICPKIFNKFRKLILSYIEELIHIKTPILAFSLNAGNKIMTREILKIIRKKAPEKIIIVGGPACFREQERNFLAKELVDYFVVGEGEITLYELLQQLRHGRSCCSVPGVIDIKNNAEFIPRPPIKNLSHIPFPTYKGFDLAKYTERIIPLIFSRGCVAQCSFCDSWVLSPKYRSRDAESVFKELKYHVEINKRNTFAFNDLAINWDLKNLEKFCDLVIESRIKIGWYASATVRDGMTQELFNKIKASGNSREGAEKIYGFEGGFLTFGIESGSDRVLNLMKKVSDSSTAACVLLRSKKAGIRTLINIIAGFPGETEEDFQQTIDFILKNRDSIDYVSNLLPCFIPEGTDLYNNPRNYGIIPDSVSQQYKWRDNSGNDFLLRKDRVNRLTEIFKKYQIPLLQGSLSEAEDIENLDVVI